jgi:hypothetical protein
MMNHNKEAVNKNWQKMMRALIFEEPKGKTLPLKNGTWEDQ